MTAVLDVIFPLTAAWKDDIKMAVKYFYSRGKRVKNYRKLYLKSEGVQPMDHLKLISALAQYP